MEINNSGDVAHRVMVMSYNVATDPDDLLGKIPPNITRDLESVMRRIEGLLPSIYMGLRRVLDMVRPWSFEQAIYHDELNAVKKILEFLDNPGVSYLIGVPFQPLQLEDNKIKTMIYMAVFAIPIAVLGPTRCVTMVYPAVVMLPDNILRSVLVHELVHCTIVDPHERVTYRVEKMLTDLVPDFFLATRMRPPHIVTAIAEYIKQSRVPVISYETDRNVNMRIAINPEYADEILSRSAIIQLRPSIFWRRPASSTP